MSNSFFFPQGSFFGLDFMETSLQSFSVAENVTADNIANVNTPGATRQQVNFTEQYPLVGPPFMATHVTGTVGQGTVIADIQRLNSESYDDLFRGANSSQNFYTTQQSALNSLQSLLGAPNSGVTTQFANFQTALNQLVAQQGGGNQQSSQTQVLNSAQSLATALGTSAAAISNQEATALQQGAAVVTRVNGILDQIAGLNQQIRASTAVGDNPNTIADQRDYLIDQLSQYISVQTSVQSDGSTLVTVNGQALVNDAVAYHLAAPVVGTAANGAQSYNVYFATNPPTNPSSPSIPLGSGQLGALQDLYNNKLSVYATQLDQFAQSLSYEVNRITTSSYDSNGQPGTDLFQPIVSSLPISASNIKCGITIPSQLPVVTVNTSANVSGPGAILPLNSANNTVDPSQNIDGNNNLANPPAAPLLGALTITVNGIAQTFNYNTTPGQNSDTIDDFISSFNAGQYGVTASYNAASQTIEFARDPNNESQQLRGAQGSNASQPTFTISDSNFAAGNPNASLLGALGAQAFNGVQQNATNDFALSDNGGANALIQMFQKNVGVPPIVTTGGLAAVAGTPYSVALPVGVNNVQVGQVLTLDAGSVLGTQENVTVSAISFVGGTETITFTPAQAHGAGFTIQSAPKQTLQQFYGQTVTQIGLDAQTAQTGAANQTNLTTTINNQRQSIAGINLDEETNNLIQYQNAYSAAAKTISTLNQMLGVVLDNLGVTTGA